MILEHELPHGSKLYFDTSARLKRALENTALGVLQRHDYREIVVPSFSFLEQQKDVSNREIIRISAEQNNQICLRYDTTIDLIRIITKTIERSTAHKKWCYVQPVFSYPSTEIYQIGAENLGDEDLQATLCIVIEMLENFGVEASLQVANMNIPKLCAKHFGINLKVFERPSVGEILDSKNAFLKELLSVKTACDLKKAIKNAPEFLKNELEKLLLMSDKCEHKNLFFSPLFYAPSSYYDDLFFRAFLGNATLLLGGRYSIDSTRGSGFAVYLDEVINALMSDEASAQKAREKLLKKG